MKQTRWIVLLIGTVAGMALATTTTTLTVNGQDEATLWAGTPAIVCLTSSDTAGALNPDFTLQVFTSDGSALDLVPVLKRKTDPDWLDGISIQTATYILPAEQLAKLPDGVYRISARSGKPASFRIDRTASAEPLQSLLLQSEAAELEGNLSDALLRAGDAVEVSKDSAAAWIRKADILMAQGGWRDALDALDASEGLIVKTHSTRALATISVRRQAIELKLP